MEIGYNFLLLGYLENIKGGGVQGHKGGGGGLGGDIPLNMCRKKTTGD